MKPTHPVDLLCCAIATEEGWFSAARTITTPQVKNNPGDLRFAGQIGASAPGWNRNGIPPIATFSDAPHGIAALFRQVWQMVANGKTVRQIIETWAPPVENNTSAYLLNVLEWTGLPADIPVLELLPPLVALNAPLSS